MKKLFKNGLIIGKFMPFHKGHEFLISFGIENCENLTVIVDHLFNETINQFTRVEWIEKTFPNIRVVTFEKLMPQSPEENDFFWEIWKTEIENFIKPDVLFASENYGIRLSKELNCHFMPCDIERNNINISATKIRNDSIKNFNYLNRFAKQEFSKEYVFIGPESTFKSTIAEKLKSKILNIQVIPEYAEQYIKLNQIKEIDKNLLNFFAISQKQWAENIMHNSETPYIIHDSDILTTMVYYKTLFNEIPEYMFSILNKNKKYFLFYPDNIFVNDEHRILNENEDYRLKWFNCALELLNEQQLSFDIIKGNFNEKFNEIENIFKNILLENIK
jgi:HTH-type transcriptional regulator, transcriptional repressor of NAD biosynthesis genes